MPSSSGRDRQPGAGRGQQRQLAHRRALGATAVAGALSHRDHSRAGTDEPAERADRAACAPLGAASIAAWARALARRPLRRGADRHRPVPRHRASTRPRSARCELATRLVVLQECGADALPPAQRAKARVIFQSTPPLPPLPKTAARLRAVMVGHLRDEKDPQTCSMRRAPLGRPRRHPHRPHRRRARRRAGRRGARAPHARCAALPLARRPAARSDARSASSARTCWCTPARMEGGAHVDHGGGAQRHAGARLAHRRQRRHARSRLRRAIRAGDDAGCWRACSQRARDEPAYAGRRCAHNARARAPLFEPRRRSAPLLHLVLPTLDTRPMNAPCTDQRRRPRLTSLSHGGGCGCKIAPGVLSEILKGTAQHADAAGAAGRHRDRRRRRGVPAQRRAGADRDHRLLHADRRRPVRLRPHRRDQCDLRRLRDGRAADHGAGAGRHADQRAVDRRPSAASSKAASRCAATPASRSPAATPSTRSSRSTAWSRWAWCIPSGSSATPTRKPGDVLVLGKPLGVGVLSAALKKDALRRRRLSRG